MASGCTGEVNWEAATGGPLFHISREVPLTRVVPQASRSRPGGTAAGALDQVNLRMTWAFDPYFCPAILPHFAERTHFLVKILSQT